MTSSSQNGSEAKAAAPGKDLPADLLVMAALVGISRAFFGEKSPIAQKISEGLQTGLSGDRGRQADKPSAIPKKVVGGEINAEIEHAAPDGIAPGHKTGA